MDQMFRPQSRGFISGDDLYTTTDEDPEFMYDTQAIHVNPCNQKGGTNAPAYERGNVADN